MADIVKFGQRLKSIASDGILAEAADIDFGGKKLPEVFEGKADLVDGKVPASQLPSYVDDILEYSTSEDFPITGEKGKLYADLSNNEFYRWTGSQYLNMSSGVISGEFPKAGVEQFGLVSFTASTNVNIQDGVLGGATPSSAYDSLLPKHGAGLVWFDANVKHDNKGRLGLAESSYAGLMSGEDYWMLHNPGKGLKISSVAGASTLEIHYSTAVFEIGGANELGLRVNESSGLKIVPGSGLTFDQDALYTFGDGFKKNANIISLSLGDGLEFESPLTDTALSVKIAGTDVNAGGITFQNVQQGLGKSQAGLFVRTGSGLTYGTNGAIEVKNSYSSSEEDIDFMPVDYSSERGVGLRIGTGLGYSDADRSSLVLNIGTLTSIARNETETLKMDQKKGLNVKYGDTLHVTGAGDFGIDGVLDVKYGSGLIVTSEGISPSLGEGLIMNPLGNGNIMLCIDDDHFKFEGKTLTLNIDNLKKLLGITVE